MIMKTLIRKNQMPSFFDEIFGKNFSKYAAEPVEHFNEPAINIKESESDFQIEIAAPGMEKSDFMVSLEQNILTISTEKKKKKRKRLQIIPVKNLAISVLNADSLYPRTKWMPKRLMQNTMRVY